MPIMVFNLDLPLLLKQSQDGSCDLVEQSFKVGDEEILVLIHLKGANLIVLPLPDLLQQANGGQNGVVQIPFSSGKGPQTLAVFTGGKGNLAAYADANNGCSNFLCDLNIVCSA